MGLSASIDKDESTLKVLSGTGVIWFRFILEGKKLIVDYQAHFVLAALVIRWI